MSARTKGKPRPVGTFRNVWRDPRVTDRLIILIIILKSKLRRDAAVVTADDLRKDRGWSRKTFFRTLSLGRKLNIIQVIPQSRRGNQTANMYFVNDEHFARFLCKKRRIGGVKKTTPVPSVQVQVAGRTNVIEFRAAKTA